MTYAASAGLIIPGGLSTTIWKLAEIFGLIGPHAVRGRVRGRLQRVSRRTCGIAPCAKGWCRRET